MRKVAARELRTLGVGHGKPLPLPPGLKLDVDLVKAMIGDELERLHGDDTATWIRVLKRAEKRITKEPAHTAICELLAELEASSGKRALVGMSLRHETTKGTNHQ